MVPGSLLNRSTRRLTQPARSQREVRSERQARLALRLVLVFCLISFAAGTGASPPVQSAQLQSQTVELKLGEPVSNEIRGDERAAFSVSIPQNKYFRISVDQQGVALSVELFDRDGKSIVKLES